MQVYRYQNFPTVKIGPGGRVKITKLLIPLEVPSWEKKINWNHRYKWRIHYLQHTQTRKTQNVSDLKDIITKKLPLGTIDWEPTIFNVDKCVLIVFTPKGGKYNVQPTILSPMKLHLFANTTTKIFRHAKKLRKRYLSNEGHVKTRKNI